MFRMHHKIAEDIALVPDHGGRILLGPTTRPHWVQVAEALRYASGQSPWEDEMYDDEGIMRMVREFEIGASLRAEAGFGGNSKVLASRRYERDQRPLVSLQLVLMTGFGDAHLIWQVYTTPANEGTYRTFPLYVPALNYADALADLLDGGMTLVEHGPAWPTEEDLSKIEDL